MPLTLQVHSIKNISTGVELLDLQKPTEILEYGSKELVVNLPAKLREGVLVTMKIKLLDKNDMIDTTATGKIITAAPVESQLFRTQIHLSQIDHKVWEKFLNRCKEKQGRADKVFSSIKGDES